LGRWKRNAALGLIYAIKSIHHEIITKTEITRMSAAVEGTKFPTKDLRIFWSILQQSRRGRSNSNNSSH